MTDAPGLPVDDTEASAGPRKPGPAARIIPWLITIACFAYLYARLAGAAGDQSVVAYLAGVFASVNWGRWLLLMIPYSVLFLIVDTLVLWRVVNWFNAKIPYNELVPVRASSYIISIINEQVGKGAIALYLNRRFGVPGWQVGSSMLFIMFCEFFYLLSWANIGYWLEGDALPEVFGLIPWLGLGAIVFLGIWILFFSGRILPGAEGFRERHILHAFSRANLGHYLVVLLIRSPALIGAVFVYKWALDLFGVEASFTQMLGVLPVIFFGAAVPTPMRAAAITLWVTLFPGYEGQMTAFGIVQHNFFIFFNAAIGLIFLRKANQELFGSDGAAPAKA
ncbi:MAG: hypothetical protein QNK05_14555 [Myxococcota bacterium]|nr:hypothetical protein [Myxococcota bacterium]